MYVMLSKLSSGEINEKCWWSTETVAITSNEKTEGKEVDQKIFHSFFSKSTVRKRKSKDDT